MLLGESPQSSSVGEALKQEHVDTYVRLGFVCLNLQDGNN